MARAIGNFFIDGFIDEEEYLILQQLPGVQPAGAGEEEEGDEEGVVGQQRRWDLFNFDDWTDADCWTDLRFRKVDIPRMCNAFHLEDEMKTYNRVRFSAIEGFCLLCRRLAFPCRYFDLIPKFGRPKSVLCVIFNHMLILLYDRFFHLLNSFNQNWLSRENLKQFCQKIHSKGAPLDNCWGFIDGTLRPITRPNINQRIMYNGHKRVHGFKFQSITAPNGLIVNFFGSLEGSRHDSFLLAQSGVLPLLEQHSFGPAGEILCIYGDPAYPLSIHLQTGFRNAVHLEEQQYNQRMSRVRVSVEWVFGDIIERFRFTDFKKMMKSGLSPVAKQYAVSALLTNARTCLHGSITSTFFDCQPPLLEEYFQLQPN